MASCDLGLLIYCGNDPSDEYMLSRLNRFVKNTSYCGLSGDSKMDLLLTGLVALWYLSYFETVFDFRKFSDERSTRRYGINYFVRPDFDAKYPAEGTEFRQVELQVEEEHVSNLQYYCYRERSHRESCDSYY